MLKKKRRYSQSDLYHAGMIPEITVIVPVYNVEKYLRQCVRSVLAQTYSGWRLILVDDGSTDSCARICDEYASSDPRISVIHTVNSGVSVARNRGIDLAGTEYLTFLDADDMLHPRFFEQALHDIAKSGADVVCYGYSGSCGDIENETCGKSRMMISSGKAYTELVLYQRNPAQTASMCGKLFRRDLFDDVRFTPCVCYEDLDLFYRLFTGLESVAYSDLRLYRYRMNPDSFIHTFSEKRKDVLDVTDAMKNYYSDCGEHPDANLYRAARDRRLSAHFNIWGLMTVNSVFNARLEDRCWNGILDERKSSLANPKVRFKNKMAIVMSYIGGRPLIRLLSRVIY